MLFKYVTDHHRSTVIEGVTAVHMIGRGLLTISDHTIIRDQSQGVAPPNGTKVYRLHIWSGLEDGADVGQKYSAPTTVEHHTALVIVTPRDVAYGWVYRLNVEDRPLVTVLANHTPDPGDMKARGAFTLNDRGDTIDKRTGSVNRATGELLAKAVETAAGYFG